MSGRRKRAGHRRTPAAEACAQSSSSTYSGYAPTPGQPRIDFDDKSFLIRKGRGGTRTNSRRSPGPLL